MSEPELHSELHSHGFVGLRRRNNNVPVLLAYELSARRVPRLALWLLHARWAAVDYHRAIHNCVTLLSDANEWKGEEIS